VIKVRYSRQVGDIRPSLTAPKTLHIATVLNLVPNRFYGVGVQEVHDKEHIGSTKVAKGSEYVALAE
jgi:hypothetical protein